jgi:hypothetical protein
LAAQVPVSAGASACKHPQLPWQGPVGGGGGQTTPDFQVRKLSPSQEEDPAQAAVGVGRRTLLSGYKFLKGTCRFHFRLRHRAQVGAQAWGGWGGATTQAVSAVPDVIVPWPDPF